MSDKKLTTGNISDDTNSQDKVTLEDISKLQKIMNSGLNSDRSLEEKNKKIQKHKKEESVILQCRVCDKQFSMKASEIEFYKKKGYQLPQRCKDCRDKGIRYSDADYYDRGLKRNTYQENLDMYGPRISVTEGLSGSPGFDYAGSANGEDVYIRKFGEKNEIVRDNAFKYKQNYPLHD